ncbi:pro-sigmaK processing inhibitor BofA family protein [Paenibacillus tarimensis]|uniref:pro-sigmaK processing inhibitor BofA family protein n=1 Tax=Paenibacillus tarimensis TaxID=416012 RepID=UPI001F386084|nr:pro-sigmaK processing inhibitor BofA family protein [Paenibacillus tarimensis]MCF2945810.1 pro-sigmaK processing inhibitor BofA family protein [Paenibacillus tarimensis]
MWALILGISILGLVIVIVRNRLSIRLLKQFVLHLAAAALVIYAFNYSGWVADLHIPLNAVTIAAIVMLGIPGVLMIIGLQWTIL